MEWHKYPDEEPKDEEVEYILCVSGKRGSITYDHAVLAGDNYYEEGKWYIGGCHRPDVKVLAWMELPEPYREE